MRCLPECIFVYCVPAHRTLAIPNLNTFIRNKCRFGARVNSDGAYVHARNLAGSSRAFNVYGHSARNGTTNYSHLHRSYSASAYDPTPHTEHMGEEAIGGSVPLLWFRSRLAPYLLNRGTTLHNSLLPLLPAITLTTGHPKTRKSVNHGVVTGVHIACARSPLSVAAAALRSVRFRYQANSGSRSQAIGLPERWLASLPQQIARLLLAYTQTIATFVALFACTVISCVRHLSSGDRTVYQRPRDYRIRLNIICLDNRLRNVVFTVSN